MKTKTSKTQHIPTCDTCNKPAKYESVKTVEPGPFAILWKVDGKELGLVKVDPQRVTIKMQHGDEVVLSSFNPRDTRQAMDAIIEVCTRK